jgi:hypothetical protein
MKEKDLIELGFELNNYSYGGIRSMILIITIILRILVIRIIHFVLCLIPQMI